MSHGCVREGKRVDRGVRLSSVWPAGLRGPRELVLPYPLILRCKLLRDMVLAMLELVPAGVATPLARV